MIRAKSIRFQPAHSYDDVFDGSRRHRRNEAVLFDLTLELQVTADEAERIFKLLRDQGVSVPRAVPLLPEADPIVGVFDD